MVEHDISAVAFDIDGTLYPAWKFSILVLPFTIKHLKLMKAFVTVRKEIRDWQDKHPDEVIEDFFGFQAELLSAHIKMDPVHIVKLLNTEIYEGWRSIFAKVKPYSYAKDFIVELKKQGIKVALLSDFLPEQKNDVWGILPYCDVVLGSERVGALKPSPFPFYAMAEKLDIPCAKILYVGNNRKYDVEGAKQAGMLTACIQNPVSNFLGKKVKNADISFSSYRQLSKIVLAGLGL